MNNCPITGYPFAWFDKPRWGGVFTPLASTGLETKYKFDPIGQVSITHPALMVLQAQASQNPNKSRPWHPVLAGICRNHYEDGNPPFEVTTEVLTNLSSEEVEIWYPKSFDEKANHFLRYLLRRQKGETTTHGDSHYFLGSESLIYDTHEELTKVFRYLKQQGLVEGDSYDEDDGHPANYSAVYLTDKGVTEAIRLTPKPDPFAAPDRLVSTGDPAVDSKINHARQLFFKQGSTMEDLRSACVTLAAVLEPIRPKLPLVFANDDVSDFFKLVNAFDVRHNNDRTKQLHHREQLEWVFNTLLNTIITYTKLEPKIRSAASAAPGLTT